MGKSPFYPQTVECWEEIKGVETKKMRILNRSNMEILFDEFKIKVQLTYLDFPNGFLTIFGFGFSSSTFWCNERLMPVLCKFLFSY